MTLPPNTFALGTAPVERPRTAWPSVLEELGGATERMVQGRQWTHRVFEAGSGQPLLMYHGIGGHAETYARTIRALSRHFHVYSVDALFHGRSSKDGFDLAAMYDLLADGFIDLIDALGYSSVHFEGESMGAQFGMNVGFRFPERVDRMVLSAGFYLLKVSRTDFPTAVKTAADLGVLSARAVTDPTFENVQRRMQWLVADPERMTDDIVALRRELYLDPEVNRAMRQVFNLDGDGGFGPHLYKWDYTEADCASWKPETLVLWGEHNPGQGPEFGAYCADLLGARYYTIPDTGHWPQWERPDEYSQLLIEYLKH